MPNPTENLRRWIWAILILIVLVLLMLWRGTWKAPAPDDNFSLPQLIARASDNDWRVRAAAFHSLDRIAPLGEPVPPRDTPMPQREALLLRWIDRHRPDLLADLCEVYAPSRTFELSPILMERCLSCHSRPHVGPVTEDCTMCHADLHAQYTASSHAQSLSHLRINTVNPTTRQVEPFDFGPLRGIGCVACHAPAPSAAETSCAALIARPTAESCTPCHADAAGQWKVWSIGPQPRRASWPPGKIESRTADDPRTCIDCHMPGAAHRLTARRDPDLLRSGLDVQLRPGPGRHVTVVLTNLAGHDYPTGTSRRALRLDVGFDTAPPMRIDTPALRTGESRALEIPVPEGATTIRCAALYLRNRFDPDAMTVEIVRVELPLPP